MTKQTTSQSTINKRNVLEILSITSNRDPECTVTRNAIRKVLDIAITSGSLHHVLEDMARDELINQTKIPNPSGGTYLVTAEITERGKGYLSCMIDFGIGKN